MTQSSGSCRKRVRSNVEEEGCDFTPLSKRINNLHIHSGCCNGLTHLKSNGTEEVSHLLGYESPPWTDESHNSPVLIPGNSGLEDRIENSPPTPPEVSSGHANLHSMHNHQTVGLPVQGWISEEALSLYNPSLDSGDNPFYYETNKILFSLYWERMQRVGQNLF